VAPSVDTTPHFTNKKAASVSSGGGRHVALMATLQLSSEWHIDMKAERSNQEPRQNCNSSYDLKYDKRIYKIDIGSPLKNMAIIMWTYMRCNGTELKARVQESRCGE
jgi:hypothetical protein